MRNPLIPAAVLAALLLIPVGCSSGDESLDVVEPSVVPDSPTFEQVYAVIERNCVPCHSRGKPVPGGVGLLQEDEEDEDDPDYDSCQDVIDGLGDLLEVVFDESMPPGAWPRLTEREKLLIVRWAQTGAPCP